MPDPLTHQELANELGVSRSYVSRLSRAGMPTTSVKAARDWLKKQSEDKGSPAADPTLTDWRKSKLQLECQILEHNLSRKAGEVILISDVRAAGEAVGREFTQGLNDLLNMAPAELAGKDEMGIYAYLRTVIAEIMTAVRRRLKAIGGEK